MYYDKFVKAIQTHTEKNQQRIRDIENFMREYPGVDEEKWKENIFVLTEANKALGFILALRPDILGKAVDTYGAAAAGAYAPAERRHRMKL